MVKMPEPMRRRTRSSKMNKGSDKKETISHLETPCSYTTRLNSFIQPHIHNDEPITYSKRAPRSQIPQDLQAYLGSDKKTVMIQTPQRLAQVGFYYTPKSIRQKYAITCSSCNQRIEHAIPLNVDIIQYHLDSSPSCPYSKICAFRSSINEVHNSWRDDKDFGIPSIESGRKLRLSTFNTWKHQYPDVNRMIESGLYYDPSDEKDGIPNDRVVCLYCGMSMEQWEEHDDPVEAHKESNPSCWVFNYKRILEQERNEAERAKEESAQGKIHEINDDSNAERETSYKQNPEVSARVSIHETLNEMPDFENNCDEEPTDEPADEIREDNMIPGNNAQSNEHSIVSITTTNTTTTTALPVEIVDVDEVEEFLSNPQSNQPDQMVDIPSMKSSELSQFFTEMDAESENDTGASYFSANRRKRKKEKEEKEKLMSNVEPISEEVDEAPIYENDDFASGKVCMPENAQEECIETNAGYEVEDTNENTGNERKGFTNSNGEDNMNDYPKLNSDLVNQSGEDLRQLEEDTSLHVNEDNDHMETTGTEHQADHNEQKDNIGSSGLNQDIEIPPGEIHLEQADLVPSTNIVNNEELSNGLLDRSTVFIVANSKFTEKILEGKKNTDARFISIDYDHDQNDSETSKLAANENKSIRKADESENFNGNVNFESGSNVEENINNRHENNVETERIETNQNLREILTSKEASRVEKLEAELNLLKMKIAALQNERTAEKTENIIIREPERKGVNIKIEEELEKSNEKVKVKGKSKHKKVKSKLKSKSKSRSKKRTRSVEAEHDDGDLLAIPDKGKRFKGAQNKANIQVKSEHSGKDELTLHVDQIMAENSEEVDSPSERLPELNNDLFERGSVEHLRHSSVTSNSNDAKIDLEPKNNQLDMEDISRNIEHKETSEIPTQADQARSLNLSEDEILVDNMFVPPPKPARSSRAAKANVTDDVNESSRHELSPTLLRKSARVSPEGDEPTAKVYSYEELDKLMRKESIPQVQNVRKEKTPQEKLEFGADILMGNQSTPYMNSVQELKFPDLPPSRIFPDVERNSAMKTPQAEAIINKRRESTGELNKERLVRPSTDDVTKKEAYERERLDGNLQEVPKGDWEQLSTQKYHSIYRDVSEAVKYVKEVVDVPYNLLAEDLDGTLTEFVAAIPPNQLKLTIREWMELQEEQAVGLVREKAEEMLLSFRADQQRALAFLEGLPELQL